MSAQMAVGANYLEFTGGNAGPAGTGAYTLAVLVTPAVGNNNAGFATLLTSGTRQRTSFEDALNCFCEGGFTGAGPLTQGTTYVVIQSKAAGSAAVVIDIWPYASDGSGTMTATNVDTKGDGTAINQIRWGQAIDNANGLYHVLAVWNRQLLLAERQSLKTNLLSVWAGLSPAELMHARDWNGTSGITIVGASTFVGVTGTVGVGANPTGFDFTLGPGSFDPKRASAFMQFF